MKSFISELDSQLLRYSLDLLRAKPSAKAFGATKHVRHASFAEAYLEGKIRPLGSKRRKAFASLPFQDVRGASYLQRNQCALSVVLHTRLYSRDDIGLLGHSLDQAAIKPHRMNFLDRWPVKNHCRTN
jgi:hypothetical protein